ncbi:MAG: IS66 family transposase, partial [Bacilli bacterium]
ARLNDCIHVECNAHIIRYLIFSSEVEHNIGCARMRQLFNEMNREVESQKKRGKNKITKVNITEFTKRYHQIIDETLEKYYKENPNMPNKYKPSYVNLLNRLKEFSTEHLMFINNFNVPFDNNIAERNIRSIKTKKKVSGQSKSIKGAKNYVTLHSIVQTCNIRKMNTLKTIEAVLNDEDAFNCFS